MIHHNPVKPQSLTPSLPVNWEIDSEAGPDLKTCVSLQYEMRDSVQGVKFVKRHGSAEERHQLSGVASGSSLKGQ
jgi:hypothetical protein